MARLSEELHRLFFDRDPTFVSGLERSVTLEQVLQISEERVFGFFLVLLSLPSAMPVPAPGYSIPFGIVILLLSLQMVAGSKTPWLPAKMLKRELNHPKVRPLWKQGVSWLRRLETLARPRWTPICASGIGRVILGLAVSLMAISMLIPIPGTNTLPAIGICVTSFGLIEDDGLISLLGLGLCVMGGILSTSIILAILFGGNSLLDWLKDQIRSS